MTNYEKMMDEMTIEKLAGLLAANADFCTRVYMDDGGCDAPGEMVCLMCIKRWLATEANR